MYFFQKNKFKIMLLATTVVLICVIAASTASGAKRAGAVSDSVAGAVSPVQGGATSLAGSVRGFFNYLKNMKGYEKENEKLRERVAELEDELRKNESLKSENERLRDLLKLKENQKNFDFVAADVVAFNTDNFSRTYIVNKGLKDGVTENCAVMTAYGLVGYVSKVGRSWSKISTITDPQVSVSASIMRVGNTAIVQGDMSLMEKGACKMTYVSKESGIEIGDFIETSGSGGIIPSGIYIGKVTEIKDDVTGVSQEAVIKPGVDFSDIDEVMIIKNK